MNQYEYKRITKCKVAVNEKIQDKLEWEARFNYKNIETCQQQLISDCKSMSHLFCDLQMNTAIK